jgi:hypothetical protein
MKLVKPVIDFHFQSKDGKLQYALPYGTLEQQNEFVEHGFSWLPAAEIRALIADNPELGDEWYRTGTGADYVHHRDGSVNLYLSPTNRIFTKGDAFDKALASIRDTDNVPVDKESVDALVSDARKTSGIYVVDLDALVKNPAWVSKNDEMGYLVLSTSNYVEQMQDDPNVASLVTPLYGTGDTLERTMSRIRKKSEKTLAFALIPSYVKAKAPQGTGIARLSSVNYYYSDTYASAGDRYVDIDEAYAIGVRQARQKIGSKNSD